MGIDPSKPQPAEIELEDWLFDTTAGPERRQAEARFVHGHLLKPGDVAHTNWRVRCAQPPYDRLPIPRADILVGAILSRHADAWIREEGIDDIALPVYQGIMIQPFVPSARGWISGTGLRAKWDYRELGNPQWNPQYLMAEKNAVQKSGKWSRAFAKIGYREVARSTDERSFIGAVLPRFPCGHKVPILHLDGAAIDVLANAIALLNSFTFDWLVRRRLGAAALAWYVVAEGALPRTTAIPNLLAAVNGLNLFPSQFSPVRLTGTVQNHALHLAERIRLQAIVDAVACALYGCDMSDLHHILHDSDLPVTDVGTRSSRSRSLDARGFWRVDRGLPPEIRHTVLSLIALGDLQAHIDATRNREMGIEAFLAQNDGEGWMLPEVLRLADYRLGHDDRADHPQPVASRLGPRFYDWQLAQEADEASRECYLHARNLLGAASFARLLAASIEGGAVSGEDGLGPLTDPDTCRLLGEGGHVAALVEIHARRILEDDAYWTSITTLRDGGHLTTAGYGELLDQLLARGLLDDASYRRRSGRNPPVADDTRQLQIAESGSAYQAATRDDGQQRELFE